MTDSYIRHGFLAAVYEPWVKFEGSEWGECMTLLWEAYDRAYIWSDEEKDALEGILRGHLDAFAAYDLFDEDGYEWTYEKEVLAAQRQYPETAAYWKDRAESFTGGPETFNEVEQTLPLWMTTVNPAEAARIDREVQEAKVERLQKEIAKLQEGESNG